MRAARTIPTVALLLFTALFRAVEADDNPSGRETNAAWLRAYESDNEHVKAQALGVTEGIVASAKLFIRPSECPKPKHVLMRHIVDETVNVIRR